MTIILNTCQQSAVDSFVQFLFHPTQSELVISGFAGTGKTTLVKHLIDNLSKYEQAAEALGKKVAVPQNIQVTATTRKAAHVLANSLDTKPSTIHGYLGLKLHNDYATGETYLKLVKGASNKTDALIFIDEASFMSDQLLLAVRKMTKGCKVVFMGDPCQLLQVDTTQSPVFDGKIPTAYLKTIMRHQGPIQELSAQFRDTVITNKFHPILHGISEMVKHVPGDQFQSLIDKEFLNDNFKADSSAKILAWTNTRVNDYNNYVSELRGITESFPSGEVLLTNKPIIVNSKIEAGTDSPVKVFKATPAQKYDIDGYDVEISVNTLFNLDTISVFVPSSQVQAKALMRYFANNKKWKEYFTVKEQWGDLRQPYASTVHKSQGSTYGKVFVDLSDIGRCNIPDATARLLYVAVSRASDQVILYGNLPDKYLGVINGGIQLQYA
jgi:hypothetical protein